MKKRKSMRKCIIMTIVLLSFQGMGYAQKPLVNDQWQRRTEELASCLKKEWVEGWNNMNQSVTRSSIESSRIDLLNAEYIPMTIFVLDYASFQGLTSESNLEFLVKLDTTRIDYVVLNKKENEVVMQTGGIFMNGRWRDKGFGIYGPTDIAFLSQSFARGISLYKLRVYASPDWAREYLFFIENGQLMAWRPELHTPQPLIETLLKYKEKQKSGLE